MIKPDHGRRQSMHHPVPLWPDLDDQTVGMDIRPTDRGKGTMPRFEEQLLALLGRENLTLRFSIKLSPLDNVTRSTRFILLSPATAAPVTSIPGSSQPQSFNIFAAGSAL